MGTGEIVSFCFEAAAVRGLEPEGTFFALLSFYHTHPHALAQTKTRTLFLATRLQAAATLIKLTKNNAECLKKEEGEELEQQQQFFLMTEKQSQRHV